MPLSAQAQQALASSENIDDENIRLRKVEEARVRDELEAQRIRDEEANAQIERQRQILQNEIDRLQAIEDAKIAKAKARQDKLDDYDLRIASATERAQKIDSGEITFGPWALRSFRANREPWIVVTNIRDSKAFYEKYGFTPAHTGTWHRGGGSLIANYEKEMARQEAQRVQNRITAQNKSAGQLKADGAHWKNVVGQFQQDRITNTQEEHDRINAIFTSTPTRAGDLIRTVDNPQRPERVLFQPSDDHELDLVSLKSFQANEEAKASQLELVFDANRKKQEETLKLQAEYKRRQGPISSSSSAFLTKAPVFAPSIVGDTEQKSQKAQYTFEETEAQQKELFEKMKKAKTWEEAVKIKEEYQEINPYVGSPQWGRTKDGSTARQGVLIDLIPPENSSNISDDLIDELIDEEDLGEITTSKIKSKESDDITESTKYHITIGTRTLTVNDEATKNKIVQRLETKNARKNQESYFVDESGNRVTPSIAQIWKYNNSLLNMAPIMPSMVDKKINQAMRENPQDWDYDPDHVDDPKYSGDVKQINPENIYEEINQYPFNRGILNVVVNPGETIIGKTIHDITALGSSLWDPDPVDNTNRGRQRFQNQKSPVKIYESQAIQTLTEKSKTSEGQKELVGEAIGEYFLVRGFGVASSLATVGIKKIYDKLVIAPQTKHIAETIASKIRVGQAVNRNPQTEALIAKFPTMPESMKREIRRGAPDEKVGIEYLDPHTALIKRGLETNEVQTPYIVVKNVGRKRYESKLYETFQGDKPGAYRNIQVMGNQNKELSQGIKQADDITEYPANRDNVLGVDNNLHLAPVGTAERVGTEGLAEAPLSVIKKIETAKLKTGTIIYDTQRISKGPSKIATAASKKEGDTYAGKLGSKEMDLYVNPASKRNKKEITPYAKTFKDEIKNDVGEIPIGPGNKSITKIDDKIPNADKKEALEKVIRATHKNEITTDITTRGSSIATTGTIPILTHETTHYQHPGASKIDTKESQISEVAIDQNSRIDTNIDTVQDLRNNQMSEIKSKIDTGISTKTHSGYSLITTPQSKQKINTRQVVDTEIIQTPKTKQELKITSDQVITPAQIVTTVHPPYVPVITLKTPPKRPPVVPSAKPPIDAPNRIDTKETRIKKPKISYFRWNVNTDSVGQYLPTRADLYTSKSPKVITKIDKLERTINSPKYQRKETKKESRSFKGLFNLFSTDHEQINPHGAYIPNVSSPQKTKKAKKFLKNFAFNLKI